MVDELDEERKAALQLVLAQRELVDVWHGKVGALVEGNYDLEGIYFHLIEPRCSTLHLFRSIVSVERKATSSFFASAVYFQHLLYDGRFEVWLLLLVEAGEALPIFFTFDAEVLLQGLESWHEDPKRFREQADQVDLVELLDDLSTIEAHATGAVKEAARAAEHRWLKLEALEHLAELDHEFDC